MSFQAIAIVGQSCVLPGALSPEELWNAVLQGRNLMSEAKDEDWNLNPKSLIHNSSSETIPHAIGGHVRGFDKIFDAKGFAIDADFIKSLDPLFQWTLHCGREALKHIRNRERTGVILGNLCYPNSGLNELARCISEGVLPSIPWENRFISGYPAIFLSKALQLDGPAYCLDAACASSLYAIHNACVKLHNHDIDLAISGGINAIEGSFLHLGFTSLRALSPTGKVLPFSQNAEGLVPSKGAAFVALRRLEDAIRFKEPILGVIRAVGLSNDGRTGTLLTPSSESQIQAMKQAYIQAGIQSSQISYLECHATGTLVGDSSELKSIKNVFGNSPIVLGTLKSQIGHLLAASGAAALIKILSMFKEQTSNSPRIAAVNAFGFGGNNAHLIVEEYVSQIESVYIKKESDPIAIVGLGVKWGSCKNKTEFSQALKNKSIASRRMDTFEIDIRSLNIPPNDVSEILPQQLVLIPVVNEALEDLSKKPDENTGILVGMGTDPEACRFKLRLNKKLDKLPIDDSILPPLTSTRTLGCMPNIPANRFNLMKNWKGPSYSVFGEEDSGFYAMEEAKALLQSHTVDCMIVAAVDLSCEPVHSEAMRNVYKHHLPADGCIAFVLKRLSDAQKSGDKIYKVLSEKNHNPILQTRHSELLARHPELHPHHPELLACHPERSEGPQSDRFCHDYLGHAHAATGLLQDLVKILQNDTPTEFLCPTNLNNKVFMKTIQTHLPDIKKYCVPLAPTLPSVLELYEFKQNILFNKEQIEEHASGKLSKIFGEEFKETDSYEVRVRMPEYPLLLTDRILQIDAEKNSMGIGSIITETDVLENSWFLHNDRMLPGPAIEAGQSDLFLISYLGVDFENKGERTYRLLGCEATFHRDLPKIGETLRYKITIERHVKKGLTRLFFFHYDCWIGGELFLQVRKGQAGFFSKEELDASQGVLWDPQSVSVNSISHLQRPKILQIRNHFTEKDIIAFSQGDAFSCFGYTKLASHTRSPSIPAGKNRLFDEVVNLDPVGGLYKQGYLKVIRNIHEDDWFFKGHFKNDPCMPGTLMTEMAFQAVSFFLAAVGYTLDCDAFRFIPAIGESCLLTCRGQVLPTSKRLEMEVFIKEIKEKPYIKAQATILLTVDGLKALLAENLSVQLIPDWIEEKIPIAKQNVANFENILCNEMQIKNTIHGDPTLAFGPRFEIFKHGKRLARLPGEPYTFMSRITCIDAPYCGMQIGSRIESEWDIPQEHPLLSSGNTIPFCVLLEALLQPCGWLGSYIGCPLASSKEIFFRNLEGELIQHFEPEYKGTVKFEVTVTSLVRLQDTIIIEFKVSAFLNNACFIEVKTRFGYFTEQALSDQKGLKISEDELEIFERSSSVNNRNVEYKTSPYLKLSTPSSPASSATVNDRGSQGYTSPYLKLSTPSSPASSVAVSVRGSQQGYTSPYLKLLDSFKEISLQDGTRAFLGEKNIQAKDWYFKSHFFQDPVMPGSLGLEAMLQLASLSKNKASKNPTSFSWKYRGQVRPHNEKISVILNPSNQASLFVDGIKIYEATLPLS